MSFNNNKLQMMLSHSTEEHKLEGICIDQVLQIESNHNKIKPFSVVHIQMQIGKKVILAQKYRLEGAVLTKMPWRSLIRKTRIMIKCKKLIIKKPLFTREEVSQEKTSESEMTQQETQEKERKVVSCFSEPSIFRHSHTSKLVKS